MSNKGGDGVHKKLMALAKDKYMTLTSPFGLSLGGIHHGRSVLGGDHLENASDDFSKKSN